MIRLTVFTKKYDTKSKDGSTLRQRLLQVYKTTGKCPESLENEPEVPGAGEHLWVIFKELNGSRQSGFGENPLSYSDVQAYCYLTQTILRPYEVLLIKDMDYAFLSTKVD